MIAVTLTLLNSRRITIDASKVRDVREHHPEQSRTLITYDTGYTDLVLEPLDTVLRKLGW